jgi:hypothetical protein
MYGPDGAAAASGMGCFTGTADALSAVVAGLGFVAGVDAGSLPGGELGDCLRGLERAESVLTAARARVLAAFNAQGVFEADGQQGCKAWLAWQTRVTGGAALGAMGWMRRLAVHPLVAGALGRGEISQSWAKQLCAWSDRLQPELREDADQILLGAAAGGADLADLSGLAEEMYRRSAWPDADDSDDGFTDRNVSLDLHYRGAGKLDGDLTPECAAALTAVLESLGKKVGPEDDRTAAQRRHDALEEACRRLVASGMLPDVAGQPTLIQLHMTLDQLRGLPGAAEAERNWRAERLRGDDTATPWSADTSSADPGAADINSADPGSADISSAATSLGAGPAGIGPVGDSPAGTGAAGGSPAGSGPVRPESGAGWLAGRAAGDGEPGWLGGRAAAAAYGCDAVIAPVVTGYLDPAVLEEMTRDYLRASDSGRAGRVRDTRLRDTLLRYAAGLLSGPGGLASYLRTGVLPGGPGFPACVSLPLDTGAPTPTVPPNLRRAVERRDRHCAFPGCRQRPKACHAHHLIPRSRGGPTALWNLALLCSFHHLIAVHRWGWTLTLNADGTTTATSPNGMRTLHSHGPPGTAAA